MATADIRIRAHRKLDAGVTGALRVTLHVPSIGRDLDVKWRVAPPGDADGWNNAPRKELATYAAQKWFLDPQDYVVPPIALRCIPLADYHPIDPAPEPTLPGTRCVLGTVMVWLHDTKVPERLYEEQRFYLDSTYARHLAHFNLLTYLVEHRDTRRGNLLVARNEANRRVFAVDNGIAFGGRLYNLFDDDWADLRVPALPRRSVGRLARLGREDLLALGTVAQMREDPDGVLRPVPPDAPLDPRRGARRRDGELQLGLTEDEIEELGERLEELLEDVEEKEIPLF